MPSWIEGETRRIIAKQGLGRFRQSAAGLAADAAVGGGPGHGASEAIAPVGRRVGLRAASGSQLGYSVAFTFYLDAQTAVAWVAASLSTL